MDNQRLLLFIGLSFVMLLLWQALDIRGEDILGGHRQPHTKQGLGKHIVGTGGAGTIDVGKLDNEIVDGFYTFHNGCPALATL